MQIIQSFRLPALLAAALCCTLSFPAFAATPGVWEGAAEFGTFDLVVSSDGSEIEQITFQFSDFSCGMTTISGGIGITPGTPWPINGEAFSLTVSLDPDKQMTLEGIFDNATQASGDWQAVIGGTNCNGNWTASNDEFELDVEPDINHAFVQGVYWQPLTLFGWGFLADVQEDLFFCAIFGYEDGEPSFLTLQGTMSAENPPVYQGDVYFTNENGSNSVDVGDFTWEVGTSSAVPAARLTLTSSVWNFTGLELMRLKYAEIDEVDVVTGGNWNIIRRPMLDTFADHYAIDDMRIVDEGITYAGVTDLGDDGNEGLVGYFPDDDTDFYGMLVEFDATTNAFYIFLANATDMFGRYWLLDADEEPVGGGSHFRGSADTFQDRDSGIMAGSSVLSTGAQAGPDGSDQANLRAIELLQQDFAAAEHDLMLEPSRVQFMFDSLSRQRQALSDPRKQ